MESNPQDQSPMPAISLEKLRPRLYKAVKAALLAQPDLEVQAAHLTRWVKGAMTQGFQETTFPEELLEAQQRGLQAGWQRAVNRCLRLAGDLFDWPASEIDWAISLKGAVAQVVRDDEAAMAWRKGTLAENPPLSDDSRQALLRHLCRRSWCGNASRPEDFLLPVWLTEVVFLPRRLTEIGSWARLFHTIVNLHREGQAAPETRKQTKVQILARVEAGEALKFIPEVVVYLEEEVRVRERGEAFPGPLPPPLEPDVFFPCQDLDAVLLLMQEALEFLTVRGNRPHLQRRLTWLKEHRELVDLRDFLYAFLMVTQEREVLPEAAEVLDFLQHRGFPIQHQDFRDDYRAWLAPLKDVVWARRATLRWPLDPASMSGNADLDLNFAALRQNSRRQALLSFREGLQSFLEGRKIPLPKSELLRFAASFAVVWTLAGALRRNEPLEVQPLAQSATHLLAPSFLRLIRPRKGYELKHKSELQRFIVREVAIFQDALAFWQQRGHLSNLHDDRLLFTLACAWTLQQCADSHEELTAQSALSLNMSEVEATLANLAACLQVNPAPAGAPWRHEFQVWLKEKLQWPEILAAGRDFGEEDAIWRQATEEAFQDLARQAYRLAVAQQRRAQGYPQLPGDPAVLPWLAAWLTPRPAALKEYVNRDLLGTFRDRARRSLWESRPPFLESREELVSLIKYFLAQELRGKDLEADAGRRRLGDLIPAVAQKLFQVDLPLEIKTPGSLTGAIQEVLRPRAPETAAEQRRLEEEVLALLPRSDCGSCGAPGCLAFARLLLRGQATPAQCLQAPGPVKSQLTELLAQAPGDAAAGDPYYLNEDDCHRLSYLLDPYAQNLRARLFQELSGDSAQKLFPLKLDEVSILQVGKSPDAATFHRYIEDYLGLEAAQTLSPRDRAFLMEHGELRLAAEARAIEDRYSWLTQESLGGFSIFALAPLDPALQARQGYAGAFFLSDLSPGDRSAVQEFRLKLFLDDFLEDWERALTEHWRAGYRIEDWDDFAHLITKSFWHQERTPAPGAVLRQAPPDLLHSEEMQALATSYLDKLVHDEVAVLDSCRRQLEQIFRQRQVASFRELHVLVHGSVVESFQKIGEAPPFRPASEQSALSRRVGRALRLLDQANLKISGEMQIFAEDLPFRARELLRENPHLPPGELDRLEGAREGLAWGKIHAWQHDFLKALLQASVEQFQREEQKVERLRRGDVPLVTPRFLRQAVRRLFWSGLREATDLRQTLDAMLEAHPDGQKWLNLAALRDYLWQLLETGAFLDDGTEAGPLIEFLKQSLKELYAHDLQKLQAYLYLLARLEGDLDRLTALLREIRETSDIIEAAWLAFTEARVAQRPEAMPAPAPESPIPLLANRLEDSRRFNRYLYDGLPRGELREFAQAYRELLTILQFYVVTAADEDSSDDMYGRFVADNYDLTGLLPEAVKFALHHQSRHRQRLLPRKISICTEVLANRLAKTDPDLDRSAAAFRQQKGSFFKEESSEAELAKGRTAAAWGIGLAKVKNELYTQIADLLTDDRTASFTRRIGQIIHRLEQERRDTLAAMKQGKLNRLTAFYILRQYQKDQQMVPPADLHRFLRRHQPEVLADLRTRLAPAVRTAVDRELDRLMAGYRAALES